MLLTKSRGTSVLLTAILLGLLATAIIFSRLHTFDEPLEAELTSYAVFGHELLSGQMLYSDLWDHKPPGTYYTYALAEKLFGYGPQSIFIFNVLAAIATMCAVYVAARAYRNNRLVGFAAAYLWVVLSQDMPLGANQPDAEAFINVCAAICFAVIASTGGSLLLGVWKSLAVGLLAALASLYKPVGVIPIFSAAAAGILLRGSVPETEISAALPAGTAPNTRLRLRDLSTIFGITIICWASVILHYVASGHGHDFYNALCTYNRFYSGSLINNLFTGLLQLPELSLSYLSALPLVATLCLAGAVLGLALRDKFSRLWLLWLAYAAGALAAVLLPGQLRPHHFQLLLPCLSVGGSWSLFTLYRAVRLIARRHPYRGIIVNSLLLSLIAVLLILPLSAHEFINLTLPSKEWSRSKHGSTFIAGKQLGEHIGSLLYPHERLYVWGADSGIYFYSRRRPAAGTLLNYHLTDGPLAGMLSARTAQQLSATPPELAVICLNDQQARTIKDVQHPNLQALRELLSQNRVTSWFMRNNYSLYKIVVIEDHYFALLVRAHGSLAARIATAVKANAQSL